MWSRHSLASSKLEARKTLQILLQIQADSLTYLYFRGDLTVKKLFQLHLSQNSNCSSSSEL